MRNAIATKVVTTIGLLCGGLSLSYADAPVASFDVNSGTVQVQPIVPQSNNLPTAGTAAASNDNSTPTGAATTPIAQQQPPQVVNSAEVLASLTPEQRIARLENQVQYLSSYNAQLQTLTTEVSLLRGQIEDLNYQLSQMKKQLNTLTGANPAIPTTDNTGNAPTGMAANNNTTNNSNITVTTNNTATVTTKAATPTNTANSTTVTNTTSKSTVPAAPSAKEQGAFNQAYTLLVKQQYTQATTSFTNFLSSYPNSSLAADAHYWLGDLYLAQGQPDNASQQYRAVVNTQGADKRPDAMVKLGTILLAYGDSAHAKQLFQQVTQQYPNSPAASQAQTRLKSMQ